MSFVTLFFFHFFKKYKDSVLVSFLLIIGGFFRFYKISLIPCGLYPDQAVNGEYALEISKGLLLPMFGGYTEGIFIYLIYFVQRFFGNGSLPIFLASATVGTLTVGITYLTVKNIFNRKTAFLTSLLLAISGWHVVLSRNGFSSVLVPFFIVLFFYFLDKSIKAKNKRLKEIYYPLTISVFGLGLNSYDAYYVFAFFILLFVIYSVFIYRKSVPQFFMKNKLAIYFSIVAFGVTVFPVVVYALFYSDKVFARAENISIFSNGDSLINTFRILWYNTTKSFYGIFLSGDENWRHNISGKPLLSPYWAPFFMASFLLPLLLKRKFRFILILFIVMMLPSTLTIEGLQPHGLRLSGIIPLLQLYPAISLAYVLNKKQKVLRTLGYVYVFVVVLLESNNLYINYFRKGSESSHFYKDYSCNLKKAANYIINENPSALIISDHHSIETIRYLVFPNQVNFYGVDSFVSGTNRDLVLRSSSIIVLPFEGNFDNLIIDILSKKMSKEMVRNKFNEIDYYIFQNKASRIFEE